jgi:hypothetical protein
VDGPNHVRPGQRQDVGIAAQVAGVVSEALAAEVGLGQAVALDERARCPVENEDPLLQQGPQQAQALVARPGRRRRRDRGAIGGRVARGECFGGPASFSAQCTDHIDWRRAEGWPGSDLPSTDRTGHDYEVRAPDR